MNRSALPRLSRRALVSGTAAAGIGAALRTLGIAAQPMPAAGRPERFAVLAQATPDERPEPPGSAIVQVSQGRGLQYSQPAVAISPRDARRLLAASRHSIPTAKQPPLVAAFASNDGGRTWRETGSLPLPPGATIGTDATVGFDRNGVGYVAALVASGDPTAASRVVVWRTDDGGGSFSPPVAVVAGRGIAHPWLAADPEAGGHVYVVWASQSAGLVASRSVDGGRSFDPPRTIVSGAGRVLADPVVVAGSGTVLIAFGVAAASGAQATPAGGAAADLVPVSLTVVRSTDEGGHFGHAVLVGAMARSTAPASGVRVPTGPAIATDPSGQRVYVAAASFNPTTAQSAILVAGSRDGGASFGSPVSVTGDAHPAGTTYAQPQIAVDSAGGVNVTYIGIDASQPQMSYDLFLTRSTDQGATFGPRRRVSDRSRGVAVEGTDADGLYHWLGGDYQGLAAGGGTIHPMWTDVTAGIVTTTIALSND